MSKALEYNHKVVIKRDNDTKKMIKKYFNKECSYDDLKDKIQKQFNDYKNLERIINEELKISK
jgi:hypothetical protein